MAAMKMSKPAAPSKGGRRSLKLTDLDRKRLLALRKHYAKQLDLQESAITEQVVISWAIRDAAQLHKTGGAS